MGTVKYYKQLTEERRKQTNKICNDVERDGFVEYMIKRLMGYGEEFKKDDIVEAATSFYDKSLSYEDKMPEDILKTREKEERSGKVYEITPSWNTRRCRQWDREIGVDFSGGKPVLIKNVSGAMERT